MMIHKAVIDLNPGFEERAGPLNLPRSLPRRTRARPAESGADIAKNTATTQWWAAEPEQLGSHIVSGALKRAWPERRGGRGGVSWLIATRVRAEHGGRTKVFSPLR
jgi:hypothetical protein